MVSSCHSSSREQCSQALCQTLQTGFYSGHCWSILGQDSYCGWLGKPTAPCCCLHRFSDPKHQKLLPAFLFVYSFPFPHSLHPGSSTGRWKQETFMFASSSPSLSNLHKDFSLENIASFTVSRCSEPQKLSSAICFFFYFGPRNESQSENSEYFT